MKSIIRTLAVFTALAGVLLIVVALRGRSDAKDLSERADVLDEDDVARRAYEISTGPDAGSPEENWLRAVHELRRERATGDADVSG